MLAVPSRGHDSWDSSWFSLSIHKYKPLEWRVVETYSALRSVSFLWKRAIYLTDKELVHVLIYCWQKMVNTRCFQKMPPLPPSSTLYLISHMLFLYTFHAALLGSERATMANQVKKSANQIKMCMLLLYYFYVTSRVGKILTCIGLPCG